MAIPSSGEIKMGGAGTNSIAQVKAGTDTGTPSAVQNVALRGLSVDGVTDFNYTGGANTDIAVAGSSPDQSAPHAMSEFHGYTQTFTHSVAVTWGSPQGKIGHRTGTITSGANVPFGTIDLSYFNATDNNDYVRIVWADSASANTSWTSVTTPGGTTYQRSALTESFNLHGLFPATSSQYSDWITNGNFVFTYS